MVEKNVMNLELLPNEILLGVFDYLNGIDLLRVFYGLNSRFNFLLCNQFRSYRFPFNSISKRNFDIICQQHLPFIADRIISMNLYDYEDTPDQINLFFSYIPSFKQFTHLQSLTLFVCSYQSLIKIIDQCHNLCNLTHLYLDISHCRDGRVDSQLIINTIWSLPKLVLCDLCIYGGKLELFCMPTKISSSLKYLFISECKVKCYEINQLVEYTPCLKRLSIKIEFKNYVNYILFPLPTIIDLDIRILNRCDDSEIISLLKNMPNLIRLKISFNFKLIDGYQWEQIIRNYLPKLKVFGLCMTGIVSIEHQKRVDQLMDSFRSSFWIDEHRWFVRCVTTNNIISFHTPSKLYNYNADLIFESWKFTDPHHTVQELYNDVTRVNNEVFFDQPIPSHIRLPNIRCLRIKLPIHDQFWSIVPNLGRLCSLAVLSYADAFQSQLQNLLDRSPHLIELCIYQDASLPLQMSLFKYRNASIRKLNLRNYNHYLNENECVALTQSPLGIQCEMLFILINNRESIIYFIKNMLNLRVLNVVCEDDRYSKFPPIIQDGDGCTQENIPDNDELVQWLKERLSSTCLIKRDSEELINNIVIWI